MKKLITSLYRPENNKLLYLMVNILVIIATIISWIEELKYRSFDIGFPLLLYIVLSVFGVIVSVLGFYGYKVTYAFGIVNLIWYMILLFLSVNELESSFFFVLFLYPFTVPPYPIFTFFLFVIIDLVIIIFWTKKNPRT